MIKLYVNWVSLMTLSKYKIKIFVVRNIFAE